MADHEPGSRLQDLLSALAQSRRSSSAGWRRREAGDEVARRDIGGRRVGEDVEAAARLDTDPLLHAVVQGVPPGAADPCDRRPRRRVPAPARVAGAGDGRLPVAGEALQVGAFERVGAGRRSRSRRRGGTSPRRSCRPSRRRRRCASRIGRPCISRPSPPPPPSSSSASASADPHRDQPSRPPRVPDIDPPSLDSIWRAKGARRNLSPLPATRRSAAAPLREWRQWHFLRRIR